MALLNEYQQYIKLYPDGRYEVYRTEAARNKIKCSTNSDIILSKYRVLLYELESQKEWRYYDPKGFAAAYVPLKTEFQRYSSNLIDYKADEEYPLMSVYYPDVADSIPDIIETGYTLDEGDNAEAVYQHAKQVQRWGETTDA